MAFVIKLHKNQAFLCPAIKFSPAREEIQKICTACLYSSFQCFSPTWIWQLQVLSWDLWTTLIWSNGGELLCRAEGIAEGEVSKRAGLSTCEEFSGGNWAGVKVAGKHGRGDIAPTRWEGITGETEKPKNNYQKRKIREVCDSCFALNWKSLLCWYCTTTLLLSCSLVFCTVRVK